MELLGRAERMQWGNRGCAVGGRIERLRALSREVVDPKTKSTRPDKEYPATASWSSFEASLTRCAARSLGPAGRYRAEHSGLGQTPHRVPVGIHQGDNIVDDNDIFGDGVNVAARLGGLAEPGTAYRRGRADL